MAQELIAQHDGEWVFRGETYEEHIEAFRGIYQGLQNHYWALGAIGESLTRRYGESDVKRFAGEVGVSARRIYQLVATYRIWHGQHKSEILSFTHHQIAARSPDPVATIEHAEIEKLSTRALEEYVATQLGQKPPSHNGDAERMLPVAIVPPDGSELSGWYDRIANRPCLAQGQGCQGRVEVAHIEGIPSTNFEGFIQRRDGIGKWCAIPLCAHHHRTGKASIHQIGEAAFIDHHGGYKRIMGWIIRELVGYTMDLTTRPQEQAA